MKRSILLGIAVALVAACVVSEITFARGAAPGQIVAAGPLS